MSESLPPLPPVTDPRNTKTGELVVVPPALEEVSPEAVTVDGGTQPEGTITPEAEAPSEPVYTLPELAKMEGQAARPAPDGGAYFWKHRLADFRHGWSAHEYHQAQQITMSLTDYKAALEAAVADTTHAPAVRN